MDRRLFLALNTAALAGPGTAQQQSSAIADDAVSQKFGNLGFPSPYCPP